MDVKRGDIYFANLDPVIGSEQGGIRPIVVIQNNKGNNNAKTTIAAAVTSKIKREFLPTHVVVSVRNDGYYEDNMIMLEQIRTLDKTRLKDFVGTLSAEDIIKINNALAISVGLEEEDKFETL